MSGEFIEIKDGMKIRKLTEMRNSTAKEYEDAMLRRVEEFKDSKGDKSGFNNILQNALVSASEIFIGLKKEVDKALGEENAKKMHEVVDNILLLGL